MLRRTAARIAVVLAAVLIVASCARTGADEQTRSAGQMGYPTVQRNPTRIPFPVLLWAATGQSRVRTTAARLW
jgi:predicted small secreted protein